MDMRAGSDALLAQVVAVFGAAQSHQTYCFAKRRATRLKVVVHDGIGMWLAARRLHEDGFIWPTPGSKTAQLDALALRECSLKMGAAKLIGTLPRSQLVIANRDEALSRYVERLD